MITICCKAISLNQRYRVANKKIFKSPKIREYEELLEKNFQEYFENFEIITDKLSISYHFYFKDKRKHDLDNLVKIISDRLTNHLYKDDDQVYQLHLYKHVGEEDKITISWETVSD